MHTLPCPRPVPYYISAYAPGERLVLSRNRYYAGDRPHRVDRIIVSIGGDAGSLLDRVEQGQLDYAFVAPSDYETRSDELRAKYRINKGRFFTAPALEPADVRAQHEPSTVPATTRSSGRPSISPPTVAAILRERGRRSPGYAYRPYLPPFMPGFRYERIYPLKAPDTARAKKLAKGHTRSGKAVLYVSSSSAGSVAQGKVLAA